MPVGSTIENLFEVLRAEYLTRNRYYDPREGWVSVFWGYWIVKNGIQIGYFNKDGLEIFPDSEKALENGDEVAIIAPISGG